MTSTPEIAPLDGCDDPASVLGYARARKLAAAAEEREVAKASAKWLAMHATDSLVGPADCWHERALPLGGEGCPEIAEFAITEYAAAMGLSPDSGRTRLALYSEAFYRLTHCWKRLVRGQLEAWRLRMIAERTMLLSPAAAAFVDQHVAPVAHKVGPAQLMRLVEEAKARFDPEQAEAERAAAAEARRFDVELDQVSHDGTVHVQGNLDLADALDLEAAVTAGASERAALGSTESLDVRRSQAVGDLARAQLAIGFDQPADRPRPRVPRRQVILHAHLSADAITGFATGNEIARVEETLAALTVEQVRQWCGDPDTYVYLRPVIDLTEHVHVMSYEANPRLRLQTELRDLTCIHPWCTRPATRCDHDHRVNHDDVDDESRQRGPTCSCNQAPLCRRHHRAKTTGGWTYVTIEPGTYLWRSPLGYQYLRDHTGTLDVTPDDDRRRYARELIAHFGDQPPET